MARFLTRSDVAPASCPSSVARPLTPAGIRVAPSGPPTERELALFGAITKRHTNRKSYEQRALPPAHLAQLSASIADRNATATITADRELLQAIDALTVRADLIQFADPSWRAELGTWLRAGAFGQPWLVAKLAAIAVTHHRGKSTALCGPSHCVVPLDRHGVVRWGALDENWRSIKPESVIQAAFRLGTSDDVP